MKKIIANYTFNSDADSEDLKHKKLATILKVPDVEPGEKVIKISSDHLRDEQPPVKQSVPARETVPVETVPIPTVPVVPIEPKEPVLKLIKNNEGIVVGIEVSCGCGEKIMIKMEYK
jgi:hypothetical protein